jgi:hypothetical protein
MHMMEIDDDAVEERSPRIELDRAQDSFAQPAEVTRQMKEQVDPGGEQQQASHPALERNEPEDAPASRRIDGDGHRVTIIPAALTAQCGLDV